MAQHTHQIADDMPLIGAAHPVSDNLDELEDRLRDITGLLVHVTSAAAFAHREASRHPGAHADANRRRVLALTHAAGTLGGAVANLTAAIAYAGHLHHDAALPRSPEQARARAATRKLLDDRIDSTRRHLNAAARQLRLDAEQLAAPPPTPGSTPARATGAVTVADRAASVRSSPRPPR